MTVYHPRTLDAVGGSPPAAVTIDRRDYTIDDGGAIDCPEDEEDTIAGRLADAYGVNPGDLLQPDTPPDDGTVPDQTSEDTIPDHTRDRGEFAELTKAELYEIASERGVEGRSTMTKDDLIDALAED